MNPIKEFIYAIKIFLFNEEAIKTVASSDKKRIYFGYGLLTITSLIGLFVPILLGYGYNLQLTKMFPMEIPGMPVSLFVFGLLSILVFLLMITIALYPISFLAGRKGTYGADLRTALYGISIFPLLSLIPPNPVVFDVLNLWLLLVIVNIIHKNHEIGVFYSLLVVLVGSFIFSLPILLLQFIGVIA